MDPLILLLLAALYDSPAEFRRALVDARQPMTSPAQPWALVVD